MQEMRVRSLGREDSLKEEDMVTHSSILAWEIPWTEESGWLQSMRLQTVRHDWRDLAGIHAQFVNVCFTINAKIHLNFFFKGRLKMFLPKDLLLMDSCFYLKCVYVCIFVQKPRVYKSHHFMNIFILTFENCSYIFSMALDCFILVKWIYIVPF